VQLPLLLTVFTLRGTQIGVCETRVQSLPDGIGGQNHTNSL